MFKGKRLLKIDPEHPVEKWIPLVHMIIKKRFPFLSDADYDEACSIGYLKIVECISKWDEQKGTTMTWLYTCIKNAILWEFIQKRKPQYFDPDSLSNFEQTDNDVLASTIERWQKLRVILLTHLTEKQRRVFDLKMQGMSYKQIARLIKCSPSNVYFYFKRIEKKGKAIASA